GSWARLAGSRGAFSPSLSAQWSLSITAAGVRTGASNPNHRYDGNPPNPLSPIVGTSGSSDHRTSLVTASARRRPSLMRGRRTALEVMPIWIWPPSKSATAGAAPLYGMKTILLAVLTRNNSHHACAAIPPLAPDAGLPGLAFAECP